MHRELIGRWQATSRTHTPTESAPLAQSQLRLCLIDVGDEPGAYGEIDVGAQFAIGRDRIGTSAVRTAPRKPGNAAKISC